MLEGLPFDAALLPGVIGAAMGAVLGLFAILNPGGAAKLVGILIDPDTAHSRSEVRATYGGVFFGGHAAGLIALSAVGFAVLAGIWFAAGIIRLLSIFIDRAPTRMNIIGVAFELTTGTLLILPLVLS